MGIYSAFLDAQFADSQDDSALAAQEFERALVSAPANQDLLRQALIAAIASGRPEAMSLARRLPGDPFAEMLLGNQAALAGDWQSAVQRFQALPATGLSQLIRPLLVAWAEHGAGQTDSALGGLEPLLSDAHFRAAFAMHAALIADQSGRMPLAARLYGEAAENQNFRSVQSAEILASFAARQGHATEAFQTLNAAAQSAPTLRIALPALAAGLRQPPIATPLDGIAQAYLDMASALQQDSQDQFAMILVRLALNAKPDSTAARMLAADLLEASRAPEQALQMLASINSDDPLSAVVVLRRAEIEGQLGDQPEALQQLQALSVAYPDSSLPDAEAGDILRMKSDFPAAAVAYSRSIARIATPSAFDWPLFYDRGVSYEQSNDWPRAEADFRTALRLQPGQPVVLNYLGYSWADRGEHLNEARRMIETAVSQRPDDGAVVDSLGWVMLRQGDTPDAVSTLERATELEPEDATINGHLGDAYWAAGRKMEATYQWRRALTLNPLPADAARLEAKLHETTAQAAMQERHIP
jgi:tetratricopeptide (TPR) repeat protein